MQKSTGTFEELLRLGGTDAMEPARTACARFGEAQRRADAADAAFDTGQTAVGRERNPERRRRVQRELTRLADARDDARLARHDAGDARRRDRLAVVEAVRPIFVKEYQARLADALPLLQAAEQALMAIRDVERVNAEFAVSGASIAPARTPLGAEAGISDGALAAVTRWKETINRLLRKQSAA
jgi:hypothetical protein